MTGSGWRNAVDPCDVTGDGLATPLDVLTVINYVNAHPGNTEPPAEAVSPPPFFDISGDGQITAQDVLLVINEINSRSAATGGEMGGGMFAAQADEVLAAALGWVDGTSDGGEGRAGADFGDKKMVDKRMLRFSQTKELPFGPAVFCPPSLRLGIPAKRTAHVDMAELAKGDLELVLDSLAEEVGAAWAQPRE